MLANAPINPGVVAQESQEFKPPKPGQTASGE